VILPPRRKKFKSFKFKNEEKKGRKRLVRRKRPYAKIIGTRVRGK
jgi:hypothetical protein